MNGSTVRQSGARRRCSSRRQPRPDAGRLRAAKTRGGYHCARRSIDLALDALQETFTYLLRKFPSTGPGLVLDAKLRTLLYPAAKNTAISLLRKHRRGGNPDPAPLEEPPGESDPASAATGAESIEAALAEIAAALEVPLGTVKSRLHLAVKQLRETPGIEDLFEQ